MKPRELEAAWQRAQALGLRPQDLQRVEEAYRVLANPELLAVYWHVVQGLSECVLGGPVRPRRRLSFLTWCRWFEDFVSGVPQ